MLKGYHNKLCTSRMSEKGQITCTDRHLYGYGRRCLSINLVLKESSTQKENTWSNIKTHETILECFQEHIASMYSCNLEWEVLLLFRFQFHSFIFHSTDIAQPMKYYILRLVSNSLNQAHFRYLSPATILRHSLYLWSLTFVKLHPIFFPFHPHNTSSRGYLYNFKYIEKSTIIQVHFSFHHSPRTN